MELATFPYFGAANPRKITRSAARNKETEESFRREAIFQGERFLSALDSGGTATLTPEAQAIENGDGSHSWQRTLRFPAEEWNEARGILTWLYIHAYCFGGNFSLSNNMIRFSQSPLKGLTYTIAIGREAEDGCHVECFGNGVEVFWPLLPFILNRLWVLFSGDNSFTCFPLEKLRTFPCNDCADDGSGFQQPSEFLEYRLAPYGQGHYPKSGWKTGPWTIDLRTR